MYVPHVCKGDFDRGGGGGGGGGSQVGFRLPSKRQTVKAQLRLRLCGGGGGGGSLQGRFRV